MKNKGFILIGMMFMMVFIAVTAVSLNRRAGLQSRIAANQVKSVQTFFDQAAVFERAVWQLTKDPSRRTLRVNKYQDLTFATGVGNDTITTAGGNFDADGFSQNDQIAIVSSFPDNDGLYTILNDVTAATDTIEVSNGTLITGGADIGTATIAMVSSPITYDDLKFDHKKDFKTTAGNFNTDGFSQYDKIIITSSTPANNGIYTILNDVSATTDKIVVAENSIVNGGDGSGTAIIARLASYTESYPYNSITYSYDMLNSTLTGYRDAATVTVTTPGATDKVKTSYRYYIDTVTATGTPALNKPRKVAVDSSGNIYIADRDNHRVRKIDTSGNLTTFAGTGVPDWHGENTLATLADLNHPSDIALDSSGNLYIADTDNCKIRKVAAITNIITTFAGKTGSFDCDGPPAQPTYLDKPEGVFVDAFDNLYIADTKNHRILKVDTGGDMTTVAGNGTAGYSGDGNDATSAELRKPSGVFVDSAGNIYIADKDNDVIRRVDMAGTITTVVGIQGTSAYTGDNGPATMATLKKPEDVFVDSAGNLFIADTDNHVVRMVNAHDGIITTLAGIGGSPGSTGDGGPAVFGKLNKPSGVAMASTRGGRAIYISDRHNSKIRMLTLQAEGELY